MEKALSSDSAAHPRALSLQTPPVARYTAFVKPRAAGGHELTLHVSGMRCAKCIWAIESALQKEAGVIEARVNLSTARLFIAWQGSASAAEAYAALVEKLGYAVSPITRDATAPKEESFLLRCLVVAGFAMGNIMLVSVALWSSDQTGMGTATRELLHWLSALIALPAVAYAGRPFFRSAWSVLRHGRTNMDVPISLGLILACAMSVFETWHARTHTYFDSAVMLMFFLLIGRWFDMRAREKARAGATRLLEMMQGTAMVLEHGRGVCVAIADVKPGQRILVAAGEKIPTDARIIEGCSDIDTSLVTGETLPSTAAVGDVVFGGTINLSAALTCEVLKASQDSLLAESIRLMEQAEQGRARYVRLADKAARLYTPVVHTLAAAAFIGWYGFGGMNWHDALMISVTTLIITCPCALGLAVPVVQVLAVGWLMKRGVLVKSGDALERLARIDTAVFDKTGTVTWGVPRLMTPVDAEALQLAASLAQYSNHPYSRALVQAYDGALLPLLQVQELPGIGLTGNQGGREIFIGKEVGIASGPSSVVLKINQQTCAVFHFTDALRDDAATTMVAFRKASVQLMLLSGDKPAVVQQVAGALGMTHWQAAMLPQEKQAAIRTLKQQGHKVLMVGDGLNDAPSLAEADISISPATGMDITQNSADMVFQGNALMAVYQSLCMARFSTQLVKQNFVLAALYNCLAIPLAVLGFVTPLVAAIAMSSSSLLVIANAFRIPSKTYGGNG